jgi:hypothetical protein
VSTGYNSPYTDQFMAAMRDAIRNADTCDRAEGLARQLAAVFQPDPQHAAMIGKTLMVAVAYTAARDHANITPGCTLAVIAVAGQMLTATDAPTAPDGTPW